MYMPAKALLGRYSPQSDLYGVGMILYLLMTGTRKRDKWGEESAALNYIGLMTYLVEPNNELHERVKALEDK